jgi:hypothetical protein
MNIEYIILAFFALIALMLDRKKGIYFIIIAGFIQDPIRKLIEGAPIMLSVLSAVTLFAVYFRNMTTRERSPLLLAVYPQLRRPLSVFAFVIIAQALNAYVNTGSMTIAAIGVVMYFSPIPAVVLFYEFAESYENIKKIVSFYIAMTLLYMASLWVEWYGVDWRVLGTFGKDWFAFYGDVSIKMLSGLFRSPEIAAWHGATAGIFAFAIFWQKGRRQEKRHLLLFIVCFLTLFLTGRRKGIGTIFIFGGIYIWFLFWLGVPGKKRLFGAFILLVVIFSGLFMVSEVEDDTNQFAPYFLRGQSAFRDTPNRLDTVLGNIAYVWRESGIFGQGAGYFNQATQNFLEFEKKAKYAEMGFAKILGELGLPGAIVLLWFGVAWYRSLRERLKAVLSQEGRRYAALLLSLLLANITAFFFSALVFGDPFVLTMMGMIVGMLMAIPKIEDYSSSAQKNRQKDFARFGNDAVV